MQTTTTSQIADDVYGVLKWSQEFLKNAGEKVFPRPSKNFSAVSGGLDSTTLLQAADWFSKELVIELTSLSITKQHRVRSQEKALVKIMEQLGVKWFFTSSFSGNFSENAARQFRYDSFWESDAGRALYCSGNCPPRRWSSWDCLRGCCVKQTSSVRHESVQSFVCGSWSVLCLLFISQTFADIQHFWR